MFSSIRHGLFAALAGFTVLLCVCYTGLALVISYVTEDMVVDRLMAREADAIARHFRLQGGIRQPDMTLIRVYRDVESLPAIARRPAQSGQLRAEIPTDTGQHFHLRTLDLPAASGIRRVYLLADVGPLLVVRKLFQEVGGLLTAVACALTALALLLAYWLARRLVAPLQTLARQVRELTPGTPVAFSASTRRDEIGFLSRKLADAIDGLQAAIRREQDFTRDIGHELRTPLTVMTNTLARAVPSAADLAQLRGGLVDMRDTVDILFALARAEHIAAESFDLRHCLEERLLRLVEEAVLDADAPDADTLAIALPERIAVRGNRHLCALLIDNCLRNAMFHGSGALRLSFADGVLGVTNSVARDRNAAMHGFRHGQHLALRIATAMQWQIAFQAHADTYRVAITPLAAH